MSEYKRNIFRGSGALFIASIVSMLGNIFLSGFVIRSLSSVEAGVWFTFWSLTVLLAFCDFGLNPTLSREIALASYKGNRRVRVENLYSTVSKANFLLLILACICAIIFYVILLQGRGGADQVTIVKAYALFTLAVLFRLLANPPLSVIYGLGRVATQTLIITASSILSFLLGVLALALGYGLVGLTVSFCIAYFFLFVFAKFHVDFFLGYRPRRAFSKLAFRRLFPVAMNWSLMNIGAIMLLQLPGLIIVLLMGPAALTPFAVTRQICSSILTFSTLVGKAVMPFISQHSGRGEQLQMINLIVYVVKFTLGIALFLALYAFFLHGEISTVWFGGHLSFDSLVLSIMLIAIVVESHSVAVTQCCLSAGFIQFAKIATISGLLVTGLSYLFVSMWGIVGAAVAILVTQLLTNTWYSLFVAFRRVQLPLKNYLRLVRDAFIMGAWFACVLFFLKLVVNPMFHQHPLLILIFNLVVLLVLTVFGLLAFKLERAFIFGFIRKFY